MTDKKFSVAMSIYKNDDPQYLRDALKSIIVDQTLRPAEVVIIGDGPVPDALSKAVEDMVEVGKKVGVDVRFLPQDHNRGLGAALGIACENCKYDYIARMDSDDLSLPIRFERQMACFDEDPQLSVVGGMITEFVGDPSNIVDRRLLPLDNEGIWKMMQTRCGVNHVTVIIKKSDLMKAGNYNGTYRQEDFYLWARMMKVGCKFRNIPDVVVNVRSGADQFARRGGLKYFRQHMMVFKYMYHEGLISLPVLWKNYCLRFAQVAFPTQLRTWVYQHILRS
ncbi:glycosyltransferase [Prevotella sp. AGR2160]|uniref:glycosyltransferase n=1 Tax=Prevotella sp. AGR2160 TaxID=1280674 RepID=UPI00040DC6EC|nr:glycosyltransferase [Prevotella sp. AGR2160]